MKTITPIKNIYRWIVAVFAGLAMLPFENSGHALFLEEMEKFNTEMEKFIRL